MEVDENTSILEAALDNDIELPHDCKLGVCLTCPSLVVSGDVDQSDGTLDDSVMEQVKASGRSSRGSCLEESRCFSLFSIGLARGPFLLPYRTPSALCLFACFFLRFLVPQRCTGPDRAAGTPRKVLDLRVRLFWGRTFTLCTWGFSKRVVVVRRKISRNAEQGRVGGSLA